MLCSLICYFLMTEVPVQGWSDLFAQGHRASGIDASGPRRPHHTRSVLAAKTTDIEQLSIRTRKDTPALTQPLHCPGFHGDETWLAILVRLKAPPDGLGCRRLASKISGPTIPKHVLFSRQSVNDCIPELQPATGSLYTYNGLREEKPSVLLAISTMQDLPPIASPQ